jgi:hypothetical protein
MVRNENSSPRFLAKDAAHQKRPEVWVMSPSSKRESWKCGRVAGIGPIVNLCESWKNSGSHHGIMQTAAVTRHRLVDQQFSGPIPVPLGQALAMAPSEMARLNSSPSTGDHAIKTDMVAAVETTKRTAAELRLPASRYGPGPSGYARANTSGPRMTARRPAGEDIAIRG